MLRVFANTRPPFSRGWDVCSSHGLRKFAYSLVNCSSQWYGISNFDIKNAFFQNSIEKITCTWWVPLVLNSGRQSMENLQRWSCYKRCMERNKLRFYWIKGWIHCGSPLALPVVCQINAYSDKVKVKMKFLWDFGQMTSSYWRIVIAETYASTLTNY